jgi:hypothetical protein
MLAKNVRVPILLGPERWSLVVARGLKVAPKWNTARNAARRHGRVSARDGVTDSARYPARESFRPARISTRRVGYSRRIPTLKTFAPTPSLRKGVGVRCSAAPKITENSPNFTLGVRPYTTGRTLFIVKLPHRCQKQIVALVNNATHY